MPEGVDVRLGGWWMLTLLACQRCVACAPDIVPVETDDDTDSDDTDTTDTDTTPIDTAPPPPCDQPETEPNGADAPETIVMEKIACGTFGAPYDVDVRTWSLAEQSWMMVRVDARALGSKADPVLILSGEDGDSAQMFELDDGTEDVKLVFPARPQDYTALITDEAGGGDVEGFEYELLAARAKAPLEWTVYEGDSNEARDAAGPLAIDARLFGGVSDAADEDWYRVSVPAGAGVVVFDIDAYDFGSAGDYTLHVYDEGGKRLTLAYYGPEGWERDPVARVSTSGDEDLFVRVEEFDRRSGQAYWYVLSATLED